MPSRAASPAVPKGALNFMLPAASKGMPSSVSSFWSSAFASRSPTTTMWSTRRMVEPSSPLAAHSHRVAVDLFDVGLVEDVHAVHAQPLDFVEPALVCKELLGGLIRFIDEVDLARSGVEMGDDAERAADVFGGVADAPGAAPFIVRLQVVGAEMARDVHGDVSAADDGDTVADGHAGPAAGPQAKGRWACRCRECRACRIPCPWRAGSCFRCSCPQSTARWRECCG